MDRITNSILKDFVEQNNLENLDESAQFEHLSTYLTVRRFYNEQFDTSDIVTGSGNDTGIDAFSVLINGRLITDIDELEDFDKGGYLEVTFIFIQAERSAKFDNAKIGSFGNGVVSLFQEQTELKRNQKIQDAAELINKIFSRGNEFKKGNPTCRLDYVTTGRWVDDPNICARISSVKKELEKTNLFSKVEFIATGAEQIQTLYRQTQNEIERSFRFEKKVALPPLLNVQEAYIGYLPATEFLKLVKNESGELITALFRDNPRDWLNYNKVNNEIKETLASDKKTQFVLMNNGVTIIANSLRAQGDTFNIGGYSIVNGCQTTHVLFDSISELNEAVLIPVRLIATQNEDVINDIAAATNRQTEVTNEQLFALLKFSKLLEEYFQTYEHPHRLYYERRTFQYASMSIEKTRIVTPVNLIKAFAAMFLDEPHRTTRNYKAIQSKVGSDIFGIGHRLEPYYTAAFALYKLEFFFRAGRLETKYKPARYHLLLIMRVLANTDPVPRMTENKMEGYCKKIIDILHTIKADILVGKAAAIIDEVAQENFNRDSIRTESFTNRVLDVLKSKDKSWLNLGIQ